MSYYDQVLSLRPNTAIKLNSAQNGHIDVSGRAHTLSGTYTLTGSILAGSAKSLAVVGQTVVTVPTDIFKRGSEANSFTLAVWFLPTNSVAGNFSIMSHSGQTDGLWFDGDFINFSIRDDSGNYTTASWPVPDNPKAYYVVGVYTNEKIQLYIDGELQAEEDIELTNFYQESSSSLKIGDASSSSYKAVVDGIALYGYSLTSAQINETYFYGRDVLSTEQIAAVNDGALWTGSNRSIDLQITWPQWDGLFYNTTAQADELRPQYDPDTQLTFVNSQWVTSIPLDATENSSIGGVQIEWDGDGTFDVEYSLDDTNWFDVGNAIVIPATQNFDTTGVVMDLRVTFAGGVADDNSVIRAMRATVFADDIVLGTDNSRQVILDTNVSTALDYEEPVEKSFGSGFTLQGGSIYVGNDTEDNPVTTKAVEMWVLPDSATNAYLFDNRAYTGNAYLRVGAGGNWEFSGGTLYINGTSVSSGSTAAKMSEWTHVLFTLSTPTVVGAVVGDSGYIGVIGMFIFYQQTVSNPTKLFSLYSSVSSLSATESSTVTVAEAASPVAAYTLVWDTVA